MATAEVEIVDDGQADVEAAAAPVVQGLETDTDAMQKFCTQLIQEGEAEALKVV